MVPGHENDFHWMHAACAFTKWFLKRKLVMFSAFNQHIFPWDNSSEHITSVRLTIATYITFIFEMPATDQPRNRRLLKCRSPLPIASGFGRGQGRDTQQPAFGHRWRLLWSLGWYHYGWAFYERPAFSNCFCTSRIQVSVWPMLMSRPGGSSTDEKTAPTNT